MSLRGKGISDRRIGSGRFLSLFFPYNPPEKRRGRLLHLGKTTLARNDIDLKLGL